MGTPSSILTTDEPIHPVNRSTRRTRTFVARLVVYLAMIVLSLAVLIPFIWMISTSLKSSSTMWSFPPKWIPKPFEWKNYSQAFHEVPLARYFGNTMIIEFFVILGQVLSCTLIAYGFSRFRFRGREVLFMIVLATMLIPQQVTMIPMFEMFKWLGWINTYLPLTVPSYFGNPFYIFMMRQFLQTIPLDLDEAAKIDGANSFQTLWRIIVPLLRPSIMIVIVFTFTDVYNDFMGPLIYLDDPNKFTLAVGLENFVSGFGTEWNLLMAGSTVALLPLLILYYFAQKQLIGGIASMGLKG